jgi:ubiquinone/menaquinone biosynthesis C-methylase UbiE
MYRRAMRAVQRRRRPPVSPDTQWFWDHYASAADQIVEFFAGGGVELKGRAVADIGCGDGIMALGVAQRAGPARLVGYDVNAVDVELLTARAREHEVAQSLPSNLRFELSEPTTLPAADESFDIVYTWSAFEHVGDPPALFREIRRILRPEGVLMLQLWPFYYSSHGSHLWEWFPEPYHHLVQDDDEIASAMRASGRHTSEWTEYMLGEYRTLNRVTIDELQDGMADAGLTIRKFEIMGDSAHVPAGAARIPVSQLGIAGVKLLAVPS